jgi:hypothetical protein
MLQYVDEPHALVESLVEPLAFQGEVHHQVIQVVEVGTGGGTKGWSPPVS